MWLRDSTAQVRPLGDCERRRRPHSNDCWLSAGFRYICIDPYANAFNETDNHAGHQTDKTPRKMNGWIWERKYEIDSLCYPVQLAYLLYKNTG